MAIQQTFEFLDLGPEPAAGLNPEPPALAAGVEGGVNQPLRPEASAYGSRRKTDSSAQPTAGAVGSGLLRELRARAGCIDIAPDQDVGQTLSTGSAAINRLLPRGGLRADAITEWVAEAEGSGAAALSMITAAIHLNSAQGRGPLVVVSRPDDFYPPAAVSLGISADRILWVRPTRHADLVWAIDQALRCQAVAAVWAPIRARLDDRDARRFQLAAEAGHTPGLLIRAAATRGCPSFADVRFHVGNRNRNASPLARHAGGRVMSVTLDRCRGGKVGHSVWVQIDDQARIEQVTPQQPGVSKDETAAVRLASKLAHPTAAGRRDRKPIRRSA